jgi:hypothetical protein
MRFGHESGQDVRVESLGAVGHGQCRSAVRAFRWLGLSLLAAVVSASWATVAYLDRLPVTDSIGRGLMYVWRGHDSDWWCGVSLGVALVTSTAMLGWLFQSGVRLLRRSWREAAVGIAVTVWLVGAAVTVLVGGLAMVYVGGTLTTVHGPGGVTRIVTQDEFDGDVVEVYRPLGHFTYRRESGDEGGLSLDPRRGPCSITKQRSARDLVLSCGDTSYAPR